MTTVSSILLVVVLIMHLEFFPHFDIPMPYSYGKL